jgi:hypothetical protein
LTPGFLQLGAQGAAYLTSMVHSWCTIEDQVAQARFGSGCCHGPILSCGEEQFTSMSQPRGDHLGRGISNGEAQRRHPWFAPDRRADSDMDVLRIGLGLVESPRWHEGRLWFSDGIAGEITAIDDVGVSELIVRHESLPLCFDFLPAGRPVLVSNQQMALLTLEDDGSLRRQDRTASLVLDEPP